MKLLVSLLLLSAVVLSGCSTFHTTGSPETCCPLRCQTIPGAEEGQRLCVLLTRNRGDLWFVMGRSEYADSYAVPELAFMGDEYGAATFGDFSISPHGRYLAVVIAEEGHPTLHVVPLQQILLGETNLRKIPSLPVYPGGIGLEGWLDDDRLVVSSDQDLSRYRHGDELTDVRNYVVHLPAGQVTVADPGGN